MLVSNGTEAASILRVTIIVYFNDMNNLCVWLCVVDEWIIFRTANVFVNIVHLYIVNFNVQQCTLKLVTIVLVIIAIIIVFSARRQSFYLIVRS